LTGRRAEGTSKEAGQEMRLISSLRLLSLYVIINANLL